MMIMQGLGDFTEKDLLLRTYVQKRKFENLFNLDTSPTFSPLSPIIRKSLFQFPQLNRYLYKFFLKRK